MSVRRFTRLTSAFSNKVENHTAALGLFHAHYNLSRIHKSLRVTPAMAAGVESRVWEIADLVGAAAGSGGGEAGTLQEGDFKNRPLPATWHVCHGTSHSCHATRSICRVISDSCHVTRTICHVISHSCHVTRSICHGRFHSCHVTRSVCHVISHSCRVTRTICHGRFHSCHATRSVCHGRYHSCHAPIDLPMLLDPRASDLYSPGMPSVAHKLATKLEEWSPEVSREVEVLVADIIELTDLKVLDLSRSRQAEQEVLDLLDEPISR